MVGRAVRPGGTAPGEFGLHDSRKGKAEYPRAVVVDWRARWRPSCADDSNSWNRKHSHHSPPDRVFQKQSLSELVT